MDKLESFNFAKLDKTDDYFSKWRDIHQEIRIPTLFRLASTLLSIPVSSASIERTFNHLRLIKNHLRTSLNDDTLKACLLIHQYGNLEMNNDIAHFIDKLQTSKKDNEVSLNLQEEKKESCVSSESLSDGIEPNTSSQHYENQELVIETVKSVQKAHKQVGITNFFPSSSKKPESEVLDTVEKCLQKENISTSSSRKGKNELIGF